MLKEDEESRKIEKGTNGKRGKKRKVKIVPLF